MILFVCFFFNFIRSSQLPPRSTRLLNRSRLQQGNLNANGTESPRSIENLHLINCKTALRLSPQLGRDSANGSPDDQLFMLDKTLRNSLIQDVEYCKQQMLQLRSILQEVSLAAFLYILNQLLLHAICAMHNALYQYGCMCNWCICMRAFVFVLFDSFIIFQHKFFVCLFCFVPCFCYCCFFEILCSRLTFVA